MFVSGHEERRAGAACSVSPSLAPLSGARPIFRKRTAIFFRSTVDFWFVRPLAGERPRDFAYLARAMGIEARPGHHRTATRSRARWPSGAGPRVYTPDLAGDHGCTRAWSGSDDARAGPERRRSHLRDRVVHGVTPSRPVWTGARPTLVNGRSHVGRRAVRSRRRAVIPVQGGDHTLDQAR